MLNWYAVYVRARHEHVTQVALLKKNIETFLPTFQSLRHWKDRKKWMNLPLFPSYLFVRIMPSPSEFLHVYKTTGVVKILSVEADRPTPVASEEIDSLKIIIENGTDFDIYPHLLEGTEVTVTRGPLKGAKGVIVKKFERTMLHVNINILGRCVGVDIHSDCVGAI